MVAEDWVGEGLEGEGAAPATHGAAQGQCVVAKRIGDHHADRSGIAGRPVQKRECSRDRQRAKGRKRAGRCGKNGLSGHQRRSSALQDFSSGRVRGMKRSIAVSWGRSPFSFG